MAIPAVAAGAALIGFGETTLAQRAPLTAGQVVDRIKQNLGVAWR